MSACRIRTLSCLFFCLLFAPLAAIPVLAQNSGGGSGYGAHWQITLTADGYTTCSILDEYGDAVDPFPSMDHWNSVQQTYNPDSIRPAYCYNLVTHDQTIDLWASGKIHVVCAWVDYFGNPVSSPPPPSKIYLKKYVSASWSANFMNVDVTGTGTADNGCHDPCLSHPHGGVSQGTHVNGYDSSSGVVSFDIPVKAEAHLGQNIYGETDYWQGSAGVVINCTVQETQPIVQGASTSLDYSVDPLFLSGTACRAKGQASVLDGYLTHAQLLINGTVVNEYLDNGSHLTDKSLEAWFDSTHFSDASPISLQVKVWDSAGNYYDGDISPPAYNKAYLLANNTFSGIGAWLEALNAAASAMNHTATANAEDTKFTILNNLPRFTVFAIDTHGNDSDFLDCFGVSGGSNDHRIFYSDIQNAINNKMTGQPAYYLYPPYNFVDLEACNNGGNLPYTLRLGLDSSSALSDTIANAFGITTGCMDRACLAFNTELLSCEENRHWSERVWNNLAQGQTIREAVLHSSLDGPPLDDDEPVEDYHARIAHPVIFGDPSMKLHGLYGVPGLTWFLPIIDTSTGGTGGSGGTGGPGPGTPPAGGGGASGPPPG